MTSSTVWTAAKRRAVTFSLSQQRSAMNQITVLGCVPVIEEVVALEVTRVVS